MTTQSGIDGYTPPAFRFGGLGASPLVARADILTANLTAKGAVLLGGGAATVGALAVGTDGQVLTADSAQSLGAKWATIFQALAKGASITTDETTASASYTNLSTVGPTVTITTGTLALVMISADLYNGGGVAEDVWASVDVSGATTIAADDQWGIREKLAAGGDIRASSPHLFTLTAGSNVFTMKYKSGGGGTVHFNNRELIVMTVGAG